MRAFIKRVLGQRFISFCCAYSVVPGAQIRELRRILALIRCRRRYADDAEVRLCQLRTSAHVLDKGLQADKWEPGRGKAQYETLCRHVDRLKDSAFNADPSYKWALQKKAEYEEKQRSGMRYQHSSKPASTAVSKNDLLHLIQSRRSIRSFEHRPIESEILEELANVVDWSPTSCNRQPAKLFMTQNPEKVATCLRQCAGATCLGAATPCFIAVCADTRCYMIQDRNLPFIDVSLGLQNMLLMAHLQGIEATIMNWMHHTRKEETNLRETLDIPEYYVIIMNLILGYPKYTSPAPGRKSTNLAYTWVE